MSSTQINTKGKIWGLAAIAGVIAFLALNVLADYAFWPALVLAVLIAVLVAILIWIGFYRDADDADGADDADAPAPAAMPSAAAAAAADATTSTAAKSSEAAAKVAPKKSAPAKQPAAKKPAAKKAKAKKPAAKKTAAKKPAAKKAAAKDGAPPTLGKPRAGGADDLKLLKGLGPALEKTLNGLGIYHFDQIAKWGKTDIDWVDARLRFKGRIRRDGWVKQAKSLAKSI